MCGSPPRRPRKPPGSPAPCAEPESLAGAGESPGPRQQICAMLSEPAQVLSRTSSVLSGSAVVLSVPGKPSSATLLRDLTGLVALDEEE